ncbi:hypothetical protein OL229_21635 [Neisseriaceae bacterium JH1-16]|nr:hypothetical protein [Neisseriaceae bacterium JH1-16]
MSLTPLSPPVPTGETGGLHTELASVESALDYALIKMGNDASPRHELWQAVYDALATAADSKAAADIAVARQRLETAIQINNDKG